MLEVTTPFFIILSLFFFVMTGFLIRECIDKMTIPEEAEDMEFRYIATLGSLTFAILFFILAFN